jgi:hypothetical protein
MKSHTPRRRIFLSLSVIFEFSGLVANRHFSSLVNSYIDPAETLSYQDRLYILYHMERIGIQYHGPMFYNSNLYMDNNYLRLWCKDSTPLGFDCPSVARS